MEDEKRMKRFTALALALILSLSLLAACGGAPAASSASGAASAAPSSSENFEDQHYKLAYILNASSTEIFNLAFAAAKAEAEKLGMTIDIFVTDGDAMKFQNYISQCANSGYDGMLLSHGTKDTAYDLIKPLRDKGIEVVAFDTTVEDPSGNKVDGVTEMFQNDQEMSRLTLDYICDVVCPDQKPVKLIKLWYGPGSDPFDRRQEVYQEYEDAGKIETVELIGPSDLSNMEGSINSAMGAALTKYSDADVDCVWGAFDAFTVGAYKAILENNRQLPCVSIDVSNQDINYMRDGNDLWKACVAVDFSLIGQQGVRLLAMKLHGDETPAQYKLAPSLIPADQLKADTNITNLKDAVEGYGVCEDNQPAWMQEVWTRTGK